MPLLSEVDQRDDVMLEAEHRQQEVWSSLAPVTDPELDESVTELGFVTSVNVDNQEPWVKSVSVELQEHMYSETINRGIDAGQTFQDTFGAEASDELDEVRAKFRNKAFQQRQELLLRYLLNKNHTAQALVEMPMSVLESMKADDKEGWRLLSRYLEIRRNWKAANKAQC